MTQSGLVGGWCSEDECARVIREKYQHCGYLLDPHTAVAVAVGERYNKKRGQCWSWLQPITASSGMMWDLWWVGIVRMCQLQYYMRGLQDVSTKRMCINTKLNQ